MSETSVQTPKIFNCKYDKQYNKNIKILRTSKKLWVESYMLTLHTPPPTLCALCRQVVCKHQLGTENTEDYTSVIIIL